MFSIIDYWAGPTVSVQLVQKYLNNFSDTIRVIFQNQTSAHKDNIWSLFLRSLESERIWISFSDACNDHLKMQNYYAHCPIQDLWENKKAPPICRSFACIAPLVKTDSGENGGGTDRFEAGELVRGQMVSFMHQPKTEPSAPARWTTIALHCYYYTWC